MKDGYTFISIFKLLSEPSLYDFRNLPLGGDFGHLKNLDKIAISLKLKVLGVNHRNIKKDEEFIYRWNFSDFI